MCLLIVLTGCDGEQPLLVAANRDEDRTRLASPPGLFVGARHRMLSPRDRRAGGTWLAVADHGLFAGLTNVAGTPPIAGAPSRGHLPHLALDEDDLDAAEAAVRAAVAARAHAAFQLVLADARAIRVLRHEGGVFERTVASDVVVVSNEHRVGTLALPGLEAVRRSGLDAQQRLERLAPLLLDEGSVSGHRILKTGGAYGTVSSSLIAVGADPRGLVWRYAAGAPDAVAYREYGNLGRRLLAVE